MHGEIPTDEERAEFRKRANEMIGARLDMFAANAPKLAQTLGTLRSELQKAGFSAEESMQIVLKAVEQPMGRPMFAGRRHWHKHDHEKESPP